METTRDIFVIIFTGVSAVTALVVLLATVVVFRRVRSLIDSAKRAAENVEKLSGIAVEHLAKPISSSSSVGYGLGSVLGFLTGLGRRSKKHKDDK